MFGTSIYSHRLMSYLDMVQRNGSSASILNPIKTFSVENGPIPDSAGHGFANDSHGETSSWRQYLTLVRRGYTLAKRDPALYYLQFLLLLMFGFLVGAVFLRLKYVIDSTIVNVPAAITWIVFMVPYLQVFKVKEMISSKFVGFSTLL